MLSLARVSTAMGRHYYSADNYYTKEKSVENSEWWGKGAERLKLDGKVAVDAFGALLEGQNPRTNRALAQGVQASKCHRRAALDLTFSAPKSVSLRALVGDDARLLDAHKQAVDNALSVCQERYALTRSGSRHERHVEATGNLLVAKFHHDTSRARDPQLHTHCVVLNAVRRKDGAWRSLHNDEVYANSKLLGLVYQNELARRVLDLGYKIETRPNGTFEIAGYGEEHLRHFSKRRAAIESLGAENQRDARRMVLRGREKKSHDIDRSELELHWQKEAIENGVEHPQPIHMNHEVPNTFSTDLALESGVRHATERNVAFKKERVEAFVLETGLGRTRLCEVERAFGAARERGTVVDTSSRGIFTTREALATEMQIASYLEQGREAFSPVTEGLPEQLSSAKGLSEGQREALRVSFESNDQFIAWQGVAGAGKTFALNLLREELEGRGLRLRGFAPSAEAAHVLESESRIASTTVAGLLAKENEKSQHKGQEIWIVDEAGLLSARDAADVMARAKSQEARVIFVGDTRQLSSVGAGNPFKLMLESGIETASLRESRRQKSQTLREAVVSLSRGEVKTGLEKLEDSIFEFRQESTRIKHACRRYVELSRDGNNGTLVLAGTNRERELLTQGIRTLLKEEGSLGRETQTTVLKSRDLSHEEMLHGVKTKVGDVLVFYRNYAHKNIESGVAYDVTRVDGHRIAVRSAEGKETSLSTAKVNGFGVFERREVGFSEGDLVRFTRNDKALGVRNGQAARVVSVGDESIALASGAGDTIVLDPTKPIHLDHNYVSTVYGSQGKTCDRAIICADETLGREAMYVAISRARFGVEILCEDKGKLVALASESRAKSSAFDLVSEECRLALKSELKEDVNVEITSDIAPQIEHNAPIKSNPTGEGIEVHQKGPKRETSHEYDYSMGI